MAPESSMQQRFTRKSPCRVTRGQRQINRSTSHTNDVFQRSDSESSELMALTTNKTNHASRTWPPKTATVINKEKRKMVRSESTPRPQTATLERPRVLDTTYLTKLDMSLTRKALLSITNLCKVPVGKRKIPLRSAARVAGSTRRLKPRASEAEESWEDESVSEVERPAKEKKTPRTIVNKVNKNIKVKSDNKTTIKETNVKSATNPCPEESSPSQKGNTPRKIIPEPCRSCGRNDLPERLHSHPIRKGLKVSEHSCPVPAVTIKGLKVSEHSCPVPAVTITRPIKSSVQRPVPIKFKSDKFKTKVQNPRKIPTKEQIQVAETPALKTTKKNIPVSPKPSVSPSPRTKGSPKVTSQSIISPRSMSTSPRSFVVMEEEEKKHQQIISCTSPCATVSSPVTSGPRLLVCYLCGREFGTASLPLHEPRCLEKWERLNARLPATLQRSPPEKPNHPLSVDEWNEFAWRATQAQLVPCEGCGRTFMPDRLAVHRRSCKSSAELGSPAANGANATTLQVDETTTATERVSSAKTGSYLCYICGRNFGSRSLAIHEPQCLRRWKLENEKLPVEQRQTEPQRGNNGTACSSSLEENVISTSPRRRSLTAISPPTTLSTCHICGRNFGTLSLPIHEPQCLRKWRQENDKLPVDKRRPEPRRPDIKYTENGVLDHEATFQDIWQSHLEQLVPCKSCGRTFFPDRLEIHARSCRDAAGSRR